MHQIRDLVAAALREVQNAANSASVLSLQPINQGQAVLYFREAPGIRLEPAQVIAQTEGKIVERGASSSKRFKIRIESRIVPPQLLKGTGHAAEFGRGRALVFIQL